ncbi:putative glycolipid-binding domain-containing protein [Dermacoccus barathri]|uniref:putative glycolipid-binding domain-containing protein n=1 Tax=Dermacoccus barathri TaxID=322601 RepID=UPI00187AAE7D|nr:putative glycolipid-binding domain-containing protein [Dermacoccus barathri]MBE7372153.1 putative glycolipid-binding domain-containing protein [Dermacoccus barathri]
MTTVEVVWRGLDDESRLDVASVEFDADGGFVATGRQSTERYRAQWDLVVDSSWRTRLFTVDVEGYAPSSAAEDLDAPDETGGSPEPVWQRHLNLWRRDEGSRSVWRCESGESGDVPGDFGPIGIADDALELFVEALDVDLAGCPLTNTMPIRRLGVDAAGVGERPITTAWVSLPDLAVIPSAQVYSSGPEGLSDIASALDDRVVSVVHYRSATRDVSVDLAVDAHGLVVTYPELAARIDVD